MVQNPKSGFYAQFWDHSNEKLDEEHRGSEDWNLGLDWTYENKKRRRRNLANVFTDSLLVLPRQFNHFQKVTFA